MAVAKSLLMERSSVRLQAMPGTRRPWTEEERREVLRLYFDGRRGKALAQAALESSPLEEHLDASKNPVLLFRRELQNLSTVLEGRGQAHDHVVPRSDGVSPGITAMFSKLLDEWQACEQPIYDRTDRERRASRLLARGLISCPAGCNDPPNALRGRTIFLRDPTVVAYVRQEARGHCDRCIAEAPFLTHKGELYLEVHHVRTLAQGGSDTPG
jgi:5-methylcytosine-specific restriction enzyme A